MRHTSRALAALAGLTVLGAAVVGGCGGATAAQPASPSPLAPQAATTLPTAPPAAPADITGVVRDLRMSTGHGALPVLLVVAAPGSSSSVDRASVRVTKDTVVWTAQGVRGTAADLARGERVAVWFTGPVAESYPVQATAGIVWIRLSD
jgi:Protein of unknown function (DUF3221)